MKADKSLKTRIHFLIAIMAIWGVVIGTRLYFLHVVYSSDFKRRAERQQQRTLDVSPRRGIIYDRNGNELAISIKVDSIFAVPDEIQSPGPTARKLSSITGISRQDLLDKLRTDRSFVWIKRRLTSAEATAIRNE